MKTRARKATVTGGLVLALTVSTAPADASSTTLPHGQKQRVLELVRDYFIARDQGWLHPRSSPKTVKQLAAGEVAEQPAAMAAGTSQIAAQTQEERGLWAEDVVTGLGERPQIKIRGHRALVTTSAGTRLTWNDKKLGSSALSDIYTVELRREKQTWRITKVSYDPVPSTEEGGDGRFGINVGLTTGVDLQVGTGDRHSPAADASKKAPIGMQGTKTFDRDAAAKYARYWSGADAAAPDGVHVVYQDRYNGTFSRAKQGNNCTNFASQAMNAGGWPIVDGVDPDNMDNWTYDLWGPRGPSKTWSMAYKLWMYASDSKRGTRLKDGSPAKADIWNLEPGDLLFADWDPQKKPDGKIDHAMVISGSYTSLGFTEPTYSQNSGHRQNLPLSIGIKIATAKDPTPNTEGPMSGQNRKVHFYPVHIKDKFETG